MSKNPLYFDLQPEAGPWSGAGLSEGSPKVLLQPGGCRCCGVSQGILPVLYQIFNKITIFHFYFLQKVF